MLDVSHVRKGFGDIAAVRDVSFAIEHGSTFGLLGPNGAGKTTTMRMIVGIYTPDAGTMTWNGARIDLGVRKHFGYLPEERGLYGKMKVREQIEYFARLHGLIDPHLRPKVDAWIERLSLGEYVTRACGELSKGNQQKVQLACAAVHDPQLLVLDEPFSGLDPVNADTLLQTLRDLKASGTTLILSSHQMWQLEQLCDAYCIITAGENRASGTLADLRAVWPTRVIRVEPVSADARTILERATAGRSLPSENGALMYEVSAATDLPSLLRDLVAVAPITRFEAIEPSLHEIYIHTIEQGR